MLRESGIPEDLVTRPKLSFGFPCRYWALPGTLFQPIVDMAGKMFGKSVLRSLQTGDSDRAMLLWNLLNLYLWRELFIENSSPESLIVEILERRGRYT